MFITMLCATYQPETKIFTYATAGHEPGFYYDARTKTFKDMRTKGLILGVLPNTTYEQFNIRFNKGDMIVLRSEEHTSELQSRGHLVCRLLLEKKKEIIIND